MDKTCINCRAPVAAGAAFCPRCFAPIDAPDTFGLPPPSQGKPWAGRTVRQEFPHVSRVDIDALYSSPNLPDGTGDTISIDRDRVANFELRCPMRECSKGGFNLTVAVRSMIESSATTANGRERCRGEQSDRWSGPRPCDCVLDYTVTCFYESAPLPT